MLQCQRFFAAIPDSGPEIKNRCTQEGLNGEKLASIRKSEPEIKNRCTQEGVNGEILASIPKSEPEIKNRCTQEGLNVEKLASIPKFGPEIKNRCRKQSIPQHAFHHALPTRLASDVCMGRAQAGSTVAAKAGADAPGGGISLCFCRRGCAAPAKQAATLNAPPNKPPRSTTLAATPAPPHSTKKPASTSLKAGNLYAIYPRQAGPGRICFIVFL